MIRINPCWNQSGVEGDRSCPDLQTVGHCHNCPTYAAAGQSLLDREIPLDYLQGCTQMLSLPRDAQQISPPLHTPSLEESETEPMQQALRLSLQAELQDSLKIGQSRETLSAMIFRLGRERWALPIGVLQEITRPVSIHTLPHRSNHLFLGLVNIRGEILPCVSLSQFLQVEMPLDPTYSRINLRRMIVVARRESRWVFPVDEVHRVYRFHAEELQEPPVVIVKADQTYTHRIIDWQGEKVNYLDADRLFDALDHRLL